tara:strand:+ start:7763 stop:7981 length:219 start_codon:yes stop_codon:yes gene_type:complete
MLDQIRHSLKLKKLQREIEIIESNYKKEIEMISGRESENNKIEEVKSEFFFNLDELSDLIDELQTTYLIKLS